MDKCCATNPRILCRVCKISACQKHLLKFKRSHPPAEVLAPTGREMFICGEMLTTFILENGIVILMCPDEVMDKIFPNQTRPNPDIKKPKNKKRLAWD